MFEVLKGDGFEQWLRESERAGNVFTDDDLAKAAAGYSTKVLFKNLHLNLIEPERQAHEQELRRRLASSN